MFAQVHVCGGGGGLDTDSQYLFLPLFLFSEDGKLLFCKQFIVSMKRSL